MAVNISVVFSLGGNAFTVWGGQQKEQELPFLGLFCVFVVCFVITVLGFCFCFLLFSRFYWSCNTQWEEELKWFSFHPFNVFFNPCFSFNIGLTLLEIQKQSVIIFSWLLSLLLLISGVVKLCQKSSTVELFGLKKSIS